MGEAATLGKGIQGVIMRAYRSRDYTITLTGVRDLGPHYRRLWFSAPDLLAAHRYYPSMWIRVWFPGPGRLFQRAYTVVDPEASAGTFALDFALHDSGYAMDFARTAQPGATLQVSVLVSANSEYAMPDPPPPGFVMVADPASLPAVNSILPTLPSGLPIRLWLGRQHDGDDDLPLADHPRLHASWVLHERLAEVVGAELGDVRGWYGWVCVDTAQTRAIKALLREATGAGKRDGHAMGYWTRGKPTG
ncbi:siderophore-interacting protein [Micropruina sp.]|uniref:siderophore-interacting protein n=1 Tax=Micropruina sp. TaxID=2737536 RepID=UPI0039E56C0E